MVDRLGVNIRRRWRNATAGPVSQKQSGRSSYALRKKSGEIAYCCCEDRDTVLSGVARRIQFRVRTQVHVTSLHRYQRRRHPAWCGGCTETVQSATMPPINYRECSTRLSCSAICCFESLTRRQFQLRTVEFWSNSRYSIPFTDTFQGYILSNPDKGTQYFDIISFHCNSCDIP